MFASNRRRDVSRRSLRHINWAVAEALDPRTLLASTVVVSSTSVIEGSSGQVSMNFTVTRSGDLSSAVTVSYATADGTALAGVDYIAQSGTMTIPSGQAANTIAVPVLGDLGDEPDESFFLNLTGISNVVGPPPDFGNELDVAGTPGASLAAADLNGDGRDDLVSTDPDADTFTIYLNTSTVGGAVSFSAQTPQSTPDFPRGAALADVNGDGRADLLLVAQFSNQLAIRLNTTPVGSTSISFGAPVTFSTPSQPVALAVGDLNNDGRSDVAVANTLGNSVSVFLNTTTPGAGVPTLGARQDFGTGQNPDDNSVLIADLNNDGRRELVVTARTSGTVNVFPNVTAPGALSVSFGSRRDFVVGSQPRAVVAGDINGDGGIDLVVANSGNSTLAVLRNTTAPGVTALTFEAAAPLPNSTEPYGIAIADFNGDGKVDLVGSGAVSSNLAVHRNLTAPGSATLSFSPSTPISVGGANRQNVIARDFNSDGRIDLVAGNRNGGSEALTTFPNNTVNGASNITPAFPQSSFATGSFPHTAEFADINNDGKLDLVAVNQSAFTVSVLLNNTPTGANTPSYAPKQDFAVQSFPDWVSVADLNNDGRLDLVVANALSNSISLLMNATTVGSSTVAFSPRQDFTVGARPRSVVAIDLNNDGKKDLVTANNDSDTLSVYFNQTAIGSASATLSARQDVPVADGPTALVAADFNGDGRDDIAVANQNANTVSVMHNNTGLNTFTVAFGTRLDFGVNAGPRGLTAADINLDGRADLVVGNSSSELGTTVSTLLNNTSPGAALPSFAARQDATVGTGPIAVLSGDFNRDGRPDIGVANFGSNNVSVMLNQTAPGASTVSYQITNFGAGTNPIYVGVGDVNGDGRLDLASANFEGESASVLINRPFVITQNLATGTIIDDDSAPRASFSPIQNIPLAVRWEPVQISAAALANDPSLADKRTFDLIVNTTTDWISAGVQVLLPGGSVFYNHPLGGNTAPATELVAGNPALAFDTYVNGPGGLNSPPLILGGYPTAPAASFGPTVFSVSWGDLITTPPGEYQIARLTFPAAALSGTDLVTNSSRTSQLDPSVGEVTATVPEIFQAYSFNESAGGVNIPVFLGGTSLTDSTITATVVGGSATPSQDFTGPSSIIIPAGQTTGNFVLSILNDLVDEPNETIELRLNNPANSSASGTLIAYVTIVDNDPAPSVNFAASSSSNAEAAGSVNVSVSLSAPSSQNITIPFNVLPGTAFSPADFSVSASPLTILAGQTTANIAVTIVNDSLDEANESFSLSLSSPTNAVLGTTTSHSFTITDDDPLPAVSFTESSASRGEASGSYVVNIQLSAISGRDVTVPILLGAGTASTPADFTLSPANVVIPAGSSGGSTTITIVNDTAVEANETVILNIGTPVNATANDPSQFTLTIVDNDIPPTVLESNFLYQTAPHRLTFRFSANVSASLSPADLVLENLTNGTIVSQASMSVSYNAGTNTATFTFPGAQVGVLADGNYRARLVGAGIIDAGGTPMAGDVLFDFFHFSGDANHDRAVNISDFAALAANFNRPGDFTQGDFNYSGTTEISDFSILAARFNTFLPAPSDLPRIATAPKASSAVSPFGSRLIGELDDMLN